MTDENIYYVDTNQEYGAFLAGEHLAQSGFKKIAMIAGEPGNLLGKARKSGFLRALHKYNLEIKDQFIFHFPFRGEKNDFNSGKAIGRKLIEMSEKPEALFCYNDLTALGVQSTLINHGVRIPGDIAIMGFDDIKQSHSAPVPLSTIRQPTEKIGRIAVKKINNLIMGFDTEIQTLLEPEVVVREST
ncbi:MAG: substrate-binding domain-containing protein [Candidatus Marinimicrobia bacterium]|nr:substrate-binding domain-containing protein [Candidatus Neomarinimicrobiota bacterium]